jgi:hypothetical protein
VATAEDVANDAADDGARDRAANRVPFAALDRLLDPLDVPGAADGARVVRGLVAPNPGWWLSWSRSRRRRRPPP